MDNTTRQIDQPPARPWILPERTAWVLRATLLALLGVLKTLIVGWDAENPPAGEALFSEGAAIEHYQAALLAIAGMLAVATRRAGDTAPLRWLLAALFLCLVIREMDADFERLVGKGAWSVLVTIILGAAAWHGWMIRDRLGQAIRSFTHSAAWGFFASGVLILLFSRFFGMTDLWYAIMGETGFQRGVKNAVEEVIESAGCGLLVIGMLEYWINSFREAPGARQLDARPEP